MIDPTNPISEPERLMLPSGVLVGAALSTDGNTLALGGTGAVHLVDLSAKPRK